MILKIVSGPDFHINLVFFDFPPHAGMLYLLMKKLSGQFEWRLDQHLEELLAPGLIPEQTGCKAEQRAPQTDKSSKRRNYPRLDLEIVAKELLYDVLSSLEYNHGEEVKEFDVFAQQSVCNSTCI